MQNITEDEVIRNLKASALKEPKNAENHCNLAIALAERGDVTGAIDSYKSAIQIEPNHLAASSNLGSIYRSIGNFEEASTIFKNIVDVYPNDISAYINLGAIYKQDGNLSKAERTFQKAVSLLPLNSEAYFNLGNALRYEGDIDISIECYKKAIRLKPNLVVAHYYLANALKDGRRLKEAIDSYSQVISLLSSPTGHSPSGVQMFRMSVAHKAESLYEIDERDKLRSFLKDAIRIDQSNIRLASLSAFVSNQYEEKDLYPFCVDPMSWIKTYNIQSEITNFEEFRSKLVDYLNSVPNVWEPSNATTKKGYQTEDQLFDLQNDLLNELEEIVRLKIDEYYEEYKSRSSVFMSRWPASKIMKSWYVRLIQGGYQDAHMHSLGWLSGVVYLSTIEHPANGEGSIEFGLHGYDYKILNKNIPKEQYQPSNGDLVLFPSSLFHKTIPVRQNCDRSVIAFDLMPAS